MFEISSYGNFSFVYWYYFYAKVFSKNMEQVYNSTLLPYSSGTICLKEFFEKVHSFIQPYVQNKLHQVKPCATKKNKEEFMLPLLGNGFDAATLTKLSKACTSSKLQVSGQPDEINISVSKRKRVMEKTKTPTDSPLETLKIRASRSAASLQFLRYTPSIWLDHPMSSWEIEAKNIDLIPGESLVVVLKIYHPFKHKVGEPVSRVPLPSQEITVLGNNTLAELRDKISCLSDNLVSRDASENPQMTGIERAIDKYPSGMLYINNNFYIDTRQPTCIDYSTVIKEWAQDRNIKLGKTLYMEDTKFEDLTIRLGYPYLYQHQGNCEHLICFTDARILHESDPLQSSAYPLITCFFRKNVPHCMCCTNSVAKWLTTGNTRLPHDPFYFCEDCFMSFNYIDGKKIGHFKAYPFVTCDTGEPE